MKYVSSKDEKNKVSLSSALSQGLASDGGLFVPENLPKIKISGLEELDFPKLSKKVLEPFFKGDKLSKDLNKICNNAFNFPLAIKKLPNNTHVMELFHGPTSAFKDFGARFLAECLESIGEKKTILVATSGDTGGAVASAFYQKENVDVVILFPKDGVSPEQFNQLTHWGENILSIAVKGSFDDCQSAVKEMFLEKKIKNLTSANSINIGRVLAQMTYYAYASLKGHKNFIIPSGNIGNALGCFWAKEMGFPIDEIVLSTNKNRAVGYFSETGKVKGFPTVKTVANAMDVGKPSNLERLQLLKKEFKALKASDKEILKTIQKTLVGYTYLSCPHTATAFFAREQLSKETHYTVVATASPQKFKTIILKHFPELEECFKSPQLLKEQFISSSKLVDEITEIINKNIK